MSLIDRVLPSLIVVLRIPLRAGASTFWATTLTLRALRASPRATHRALRPAIAERWPQAGRLFIPWGNITRLAQTQPHGLTPAADRGPWATNAQTQAPNDDCA